MRSRNRQKHSRKHHTPLYHPSPPPSSAPRLVPALSDLHSDTPSLNDQLLRVYRAGATPWQQLPEHRRNQMTKKLVAKWRGSLPGR